MCVPQVVTPPIPFAVRSLTLALTAHFSCNTILNPKPPMSVLQYDLVLDVFQSNLVGGSDPRLEESVVDDPRFDDHPFPKLLP